MNGKFITVVAKGIDWEMDLFRYRCPRCGVTKIFNEKRKVYCGHVFSEDRTSRKKMRLIK
jgi:uncharacterized C2H2 Zn-finger protein